MMSWWWQFAAFCLSLSAVLALGGLVGRWGRRMWGTNRKFNRLLDQLLGDENARPPIPSLMDKLTAVQDEQARLADQLAEHVRWHGDPRGRPAVMSTHRGGTGSAISSHVEDDESTARHRKAS